MSWMYCLVMRTMSIMFNSVAVLCLQDLQYLTVIRMTMSQNSKIPGVSISSL
uniref:Bromodomain and WD repeat-containing protein 1 isoform X2 n=1 Tax=Rhizophora mucronata TaxID=61149 RepID=A0A2P2M740_RHIMU